MLDSVPSFDRLITELAKFPGIGRKTAARLAFFVLKQPREQAEALADALKSLKERVRFCSICFQMTEQDPCPLCLDPRREGSLLCVVEEPQDVMAIERSHCYQGRYHVLHGALSPLDGIGPESLKIAELKNRLSDGSVNEVILATNFNVKGETTALYLARLIRPMNIRVTRLAHGIPLGSDLEYIDEATVGRAVKARQEF
ncbi:MAG: recombination protein RecR [Deltaproteobacteria bacterium]|nr:recombination protein RecR [Deltaproteobacteria bacterium]